jgi:hypothetical protein
MTHLWGSPPRPALLTGAEAIGDSGAQLRDFWSWAMSDLRANTTRSMFAEYLIATALGAAQQPRVEWDSYDVAIPEGRIEVKASAYLQAWPQQAPSQITFSGLRSRTWTPITGYNTEATYNADVYVFALLTAREHDQYDALDTGSWLFWVIGVDQIRATQQASLSLGRVQQIGGEPIGYQGVRGSIHACLASSRSS